MTTRSTAPVTARAVATAAVTLVVLGVALATVLALGAGLDWRLGLFEHFRPHYLVVATLATAAAAGLRAWVVVDGGLVVAVVTLVTVRAPVVVDPRPAGPSHRLVSINVKTSNRDHAAVARLVEATRPEVLVLIEVDRGWLDALGPVTARFPTRLELPGDDNFGIALYAAAPGTVEARYLDGLPSLDAHLAVGARTWRVVATHPLPPVGGAQAASQARALDGLAALVAADDAPTVVIGDLNATPWSRGFRRLCARAGLRDSRAGFGHQASFPTALGWAGLPIDHALVTDELAVVGRRLGPDVGSDHRPLVVDLADAAR